MNCRWETVTFESIQKLIVSIWSMVVWWTCRMMVENVRRHDNGYSAGIKPHLLHLAINTACNEITMRTFASCDEYVRASSDQLEIIQTYRHPSNYRRCAQDMLIGPMWASINGSPQQHWDEMRRRKCSVMQGQTGVWKWKILPWDGTWFFGWRMRDKRDVVVMTAEMHDTLFLCR